MLKERIEADLHAAMRRNQEQEKNVLRLVKKAIMDAEVAGKARRELGEDDIVLIIKREIKQAQESQADFAKAGRQEEVAKYQVWIDVLGRYLPQELTEAEIRAKVAAIVQALRASDQPVNLGTAMKAAMASFCGRADGRLVQRIVQELL